MEPRKWPIAPDGYIPNSVIRSWGVKKEKVPNKTECWDDITRRSSLRIFWFDEDEEEDEEKRTDDGKRRWKEFVDENKKKEEYKTDVKRKEDKWKEKEDEKYPYKEARGKKKREEEKEKADKKKEEKVDGTDLLKQPYNIQTKTETFDYGEMKPQRQEVSSTFGPAKTANFLSALLKGHRILPEALTELGGDTKLCETITPPLLSVSSKQKTYDFVPEEWPDLLVELPVASADTFTKNGGLRIADCIPPKDPQDWTCHPQMSAPPIPEDFQPQPDFGPTESSPIRDKMFLLSKDKYNNTTEQAAPHLDQNVLKLFRKYKDSIQNSSHHGKPCTTAERSASSKATQFTIQGKTGGLCLNTGLSSSPVPKATLSSIQTQPHRMIHPKSPGHLLYSIYPEQVVQSVHLVREQRDHKPMPEWRKNLYTLISLHGFRSRWAARLATTEQPVKPSNARQVATSIPSVQPDHLSVHQRVVQKIQMKDNVEPTSRCFHHVIPMAAQHNFFTLDCTGTTQYGKLQFDWIRRHEEDKLLEVSVARTKDTTH